MIPFIDEVEITIISGNGGPGAVSFGREKYRPRGGPDGGDGGEGGRVVLRVKGALRTLYDLKVKRIIRAGSGRPGSKRNRKGADGADAIIAVPSGTVVLNAADRVLLCDLTVDGEEFVAARGGRGGLGNARFATSVRQAPRFAQPGEPGEQVRLLLQVKFIADVGIVGLPNAGKSTLLSVMTNARPKIGSYPFTTLVPNLGVMSCGYGGRECVLADVPGLIEGASRGQGLGLRFLRHVERTKGLLYVLDLFTGGVEGQKSMLDRELGFFSPSLLDKPKILVGSKLDIADEECIRQFEASGMAGRKVIVSSVTGKGIGTLRNAIIRMMEDADAL